MDYFISKGGDQRGPYPAYVLKGMVEGGEVSPDDLVWFRGAEGWKPLREVESLEWIVPPDDGPDGVRSEVDEPVADSPDPVATPPPLPPAPGTPIPFSTSRAWRRFFARAFDLYVFQSIIFGIAIKLSLIEPIQTILVENMIIALLPALGWAMVEASLLSVFGTTPGKALFRIRIASKDDTTQKLKTGQALKRSLLVAFFGCGLRMPIIGVIALAVSFLRLKLRGNSIWDEAAGTALQFGKLPVSRIFMIVGLTLLFTAVTVQPNAAKWEEGLAQFAKMLQEESARRADEGASNGTLQ